MKNFLIYWILITVGILTVMVVLGLIITIFSLLGSYTPKWFGIPVMIFIFTFLFAIGSYKR